MGGRVLLVVALTFAVNLVLGSLIEITLPSLVIPLQRAAGSGVSCGVMELDLFPSHTSSKRWANHVGFLIFILILSEGLGYVLAMLAAFVQGKAFLFPQCVGAAGHRQGYVLGVKHSIRLYVLVVLVSAVAAVYEVLIAIFILPRFV